MEFSSKLLVMVGTISYCAFPIIFFHFWKNLGLQNVFIIVNFLFFWQIIVKNVKENKCGFNKITWRLDMEIQLEHRQIWLICLVKISWSALGQVKCLLRRRNSFVQEETKLSAWKNLTTSTWKIARKNNLSHTMNTKRFEACQLYSYKIHTTQKLCERILAAGLTFVRKWWKS